MKSFVTATFALTALVVAGANAPVQAAGCISGAAVGGVAGHVAGHHGLLGAAAGCVVGHHMAAKNRREQDQAQYSNNGDRSFQSGDPRYDSRYGDQGSVSR